MILRERRQTAGREEIMRNKTIEAISFPGDAAEWQARVDLAACFRLIALFSWDDLLATHVSAQVPGTDHEFLVGTAVSALETGLLPVVQTAMLVEGDLACHSFEGVALDLDERARLQADLGTCNYMLLQSRNTGDRAVGG